MTVKYTDALGTVTQTSYNILGQVTQTATTTPGATTAQAQLFAYNLDGQVVTVTQGVIDATHGGAVGITGVLATVSYTTGQLSSVKYGNGSSLSSVTLDPNTGATTAIGWAFPGGIDSKQNPVKDSVVRSQSGRIVADTLTDDPTVSASSYAFDTQGRLTTAVIPGHTLTYGFGAASCGVNVNAGADGDRASVTDNHNGVVSATAYCYDFADRLTATSVTNPPAGADPVTGSALAPTYDAHGNTITLANESFTYDIDDQNIQTVSGSTTVTYRRDATDRIVERDATTAGKLDTERYTYGPSGLYAVLDGKDTLLTRTVTLPGGASVTFPGKGTATWAYPNLHGDDIITTSNTGWRTGLVAQYDPFGQPIDPATGNIGTTTADDAIPNTQPGDPDYGWAGTAGKEYEHADGIALIEMGARLYSAALGRFLQVDPVVGGNTNAYDYPNDPINGSDLSGRFAPSPFPAAGATVGEVVGDIALDTVFASIAPLALVLSMSGDTQQRRQFAAKPNPDSAKAKNDWREYTVYAIYMSPLQTQANVWKYGISSNGMLRAQSQLKKCGSSCVAAEKGRVTGYLAARSAEFKLINDYVSKYNRCPPGHGGWACK